MQLKRLFQGDMPLEIFITKVTLLVDGAQYPAAMKERVTGNPSSVEFPARKLMIRSLE